MLIPDKKGTWYMLFIKMLTADPDPENPYDLVRAEEWTMDVSHNT